MKKMIASIGLSLALLLSGSMIIHAAPASAATVSSQTIASKIINQGKQYMGRPYKYGAKTGVTSSFDCSSLVQYLYRLNGIELPRTSIKQSKAGKYVAKKDLQPGDLVFFYSPVHHVAIYIGNGKILHTYGAPGVTTSDINSGYWKTNYTTARRVLPASGQATVTTSTSTSQSAKIVKAVNFRTGPSTSNSRIRYLQKGEKVTIVSKVNSNWYKVKDKNGKVGYVTTMSKYIQV